MAKKKPAAKKPSAAALKKYWETREKRLKLERQASDLAEDEKAFRQQVKDWLLSLKKSDRIQTLGKFTLSIKTKVRVAWKAAYIEAMGAEAAEKIRSEATPSESANIARSE